MDALVFRKSEAAESKPTLALEQRPIPCLPENSTQVLVKVHASKINPSDILNVSGGFPYTTYPRVPGRDYAGTIVSSPSDRSLEGTKVFGTSGDQLGFEQDGAHAEYLVIETDSVVKMPSNLTFEQAACMGVPYTTALLMIRRAQNYIASLRVLIIGGSGNVGTALGELLTSQMPGNVQQSVSRVNGVMELPKKQEFDIIFSTVPDTATLQAAIALLAKRGKLVYISCTRPNSEPLRIDPMQFYRDELSLIGVNSVDCSMQEATGLMHSLSELIDKGDLKMRQVDIKRVKLSDGEQAYQEARNSRQNVVFMM